MKKYAIACDHNGFFLKEYILKNLNNYFHDFGVYQNDTKSDYPNLALDVGKSISNGNFEKGILICGTGIGMSIAVNKVVGIRAAMITDVISAKYARQHNNINVLCLGEKIISYYLAINIIDIFLNTPFEEGRHLSRINIINNFETRKDIFK